MIKKAALGLLFYFYIGPKRNSAFPLIQNVSSNHYSIETLVRAIDLKQAVIWN